MRKIALLKLTRAFYMRHTIDVAQGLLGKRLVHMVDGQRLEVEITETEAYMGVNDKACHSYGGKRTARTEVMYLPGGHAYVYKVYGIHCLLNVVTEAAENPCAVLIRSARIIQGHDEIALRRTGKRHIQLPPKEREELLVGPGKLCKGLGITQELNGMDLLGDVLYIAKDDKATPGEIFSGPRIGVAFAGEHANLPYRFLIK